MVIMTEATVPTRDFVNNVWGWLEVFAWAIALVIVIAFAVAILFAIRNGKITLSGVISEPGEDGKASLSRLQALLFTFVFVIALALIVMRTGQFPADIPYPVLALLAGSLGTYLISKGIERGIPGSSDATAAPSAGATPGGSSTAGGALIRLGKNAAAVLASGVRLPPGTPLPTGGESRFLIPAGNTAFGPAITVATAVGDVSLSISGTGAPAGVNFGGQVTYMPAGAAAPKTEGFVNSIRIQTDPNAVSNVGVQWNASADGVIVTTVVA
jgi:hypothetical protein